MNRIMHGKPASLLSLLLLISAIPFAQPTQRIDPAFRFSIPEGQWSPGDIVQVSASSRHPIHQIQASFANEENFLPDSRRQQWNALVGIDMQTKPGRHIVRGTVGYQDHTSATFEENLEILPKEFPEERVEVDEEYVTPSAENVKRAEAETRRLEASWKTPSPVKLW